MSDLLKFTSHGNLDSLENCIKTLDQLEPCSYFPGFTLENAFLSGSIKFQDGSLLTHLRFPTHINRFCFRELIKKKAVKHSSAISTVLKVGYVMDIDGGNLKHITHISKSNLENEFYVVANLSYNFPLSVRYGYKIPNLAKNVFQKFIPWIIETLLDENKEPIKNPFDYNIPIIEEVGK